MGLSVSGSASRAWDPSGQLSGPQKSDDETDKRHAHDDEDEKPDRTRDPGHQRILRLAFANPSVNEDPLEFGGYVRADALDHFRMECADAGRYRRHHHEYPSGDLMVDRVDISAVGIPRNPRRLTRDRTAHAEPEDDQGGPGRERPLAWVGRLRPEPREYNAVEEEGEDHEPREGSYHDKEAPARTDPLPMSRDRDALPFPVYGRLRMGHRARGGWSRGVGYREDRQQTPHQLVSTAAAMNLHQTLDNASKGEDAVRDVLDVSDAAARIRTWEPLRDETLNLAPFPSLATAAWVRIRET